MMAHDTGPTPPNAVSEETVESVRAAIARYLRGPTEPTPDLRAALHALAHEARSHAVPPEQLLVLLKDIWHGLPEVRSAEPETERTRILQRLVTLCIKEYFESD